MTQPHFASIEIKSFRGLTDVRLDGLSRVNIIVGRNNAGKTSVLEAIALCCHPVNAAAWIAAVRRRGLGAPRQSTDEQFSWFFPHGLNGTVGGDIHLYFDVTTIPHRWHICGHLTQRLEVADTSDTESAGLGEPTTRVSHVGLYLEPMNAPADSPSRAKSEFVLRAGATIPEGTSTQDVPTVSVTPITHRAEMFQITAMAALNDPRLRSDVVSLLQELDPEVQNIEVYDPTGSKSAIRVWHAKLGSAPLNAFGDGFRRGLTYALTLVQCRDGGVLLVDEIETAIHHGALRSVYGWLINAATRLNVQLFITTHSLEAVDALLAATPDAPDTTFFRLESNDGRSKVTRFTEEELRALRTEFGDEVRG